MATPTTTATTTATTESSDRAVLVTGGAGFIGSEVVRQLVAASVTVVVVDRLDGERQRRVAHDLRSCGVELIAADLFDVDLAALFSRVDRVVHLAARPGVQASWGDGFDGYLDDNVGLTARLLDAALAAGHLRSIVIASSSSVYGEVPDGFADEERPVAPLSPYGVSKASVELLAGAYAARGLPVRSLRYFTVYGRGQRPDMAISRMIDAAHSGEPFFVRGDGTQQRDITHVADVARATIASTGAELAPGAILNVGTGNPVALVDVIAEVERALGRGVPRVHVPEAPGDPLRTAADHRLANRLLGWRPEVDLADGIADQVAWHPSPSSPDMAVAARA